MMMRWMVLVLMSTNLPSTRHFAVCFIFSLLYTYTQNNNNYYSSTQNKHTTTTPAIP